METIEMYLGMSETDVNSTVGEVQLKVENLKKQVPHTGQTQMQVLITNLALQLFRVAAVTVMEISTY
jgi:hypothetical protein